MNSEDKHSTGFDARSESFSVVDYARGFASKNNFKTTVILLYAVLALTIWKCVPGASRFADPDSGTCVLAESFGSSETITPLDGKLHFDASAFLWSERKLWLAFLLMGVVPAVIVRFVFREKLGDYGLTIGRVKRTLVCFALLFPVMILLGWTSGSTKEFYNVYPFNPLAGASWSALIAHSFFYFFLYYLGWEFMFRGFLQLGLADKFGAIPAVLVQVLASTMLHYGHPASETFGCVAGGLLWGFYVFRTRSIFAGWWQHAALGIALDWGLIMKAI